MTPHNAIAPHYQRRARSSSRLTEQGLWPFPPLAANRKDKSHHSLRYGCLLPEAPTHWQATN